MYVLCYMLLLFLVSDIRKVLAEQTCCCYGVTAVSVKSSFTRFFSLIRYQTRLDCGFDFGAKTS